jgi:hypothetical protein
MTTISFKEFSKGGNVQVVGNEGRVQEQEQQSGPSLFQQLADRAKTALNEVTGQPASSILAGADKTSGTDTALAGAEALTRTAQAPIRVAGAVGGAIGDVVGAGLQAVGADKLIGEAISPAVKSEPVQKAVDLFKSLPQDTQDVLGAILNTANIPVGGAGSGAIKSGIESGVKSIAKTIPEKVASLKGIADTTVQESVKKDVTNLLSATRGISSKAKLAEQKGVNLNEILADPQVFKGIKVENAKINPDEAINTIDNRITSLMDAKQKLLPEVDRLVPKQSKEILREKAYADIKGKFTPADEADIRKSIDAQVDALPDELSVSEIDAFRAKARASARDAKGLQKRSSEYSALENASRDTVFDITDKLPVANQQDYKALNDYIKQMIETKTFLDSTLRNQVVKGGRLRNYAMRAVGAVAGSQGGVLGSLAGSEIGGVVADIITNNQLGSSIKMNLIKNITDDPAILKQAEDLLGSVQQAELLGLPAPSGKVGATGKEVINALPSRTERSVGFPQLSPNMSRQNTANSTIKSNVIQDNTTTATAKSKGITKKTVVTSLEQEASNFTNGKDFYSKISNKSLDELRSKGIKGEEQITNWFNKNITPKEQVITSVNPTGSLYVDYTPQARMTMKLGKNMTTLDKTSGKSPDTLITVYRGAPKTQKQIVGGDFITTNYDLAKSYAGNGHVIESKVKMKDILDDSESPLGDEYIYRPQKTISLLEQEAKKYKSAEEFVKAQGKIVHHSTDSSNFDEFNPKLSSKGLENIYKNPLGDGLYVSSDRDFTKRFGKNTYEFVLPKDAKIKTIGATKFEQIEYPAIIKATLKKLGINYNDLSLGDKVMLNRAVPNTPIEALYDAEEYIIDILKSKGGKYEPNMVADIIQKVTTDRNSKYDAVIYKQTNDLYGTADEIVIPKESFKKLISKSQLTDIWNKANKK